MVVPMLRISSRPVFPTKVTVRMVAALPRVPLVFFFNNPQTTDPWDIFISTGSRNTENLLSPPSTLQPRLSAPLKLNFGLTTRLPIFVVWSPLTPLVKQRTTLPIGRRQRGPPRTPRGPFRTRTTTQGIPNPVIAENTPVLKLLVETLPTTVALHLLMYTWVILVWKALIEITVLGNLSRTIRKLRPSCPTLLLGDILLVLGCEEQVLTLTTCFFLLTTRRISSITLLLVRPWSLVQKELGAIPRTFTIRGWDKLTSLLPMPTHPVNALLTRPLPTPVP